MHDNRAKLRQCDMTIFSNHAIDTTQLSLSCSHAHKYYLSQSFTRYFCRAVNILVCVHQTQFKSSDPTLFCTMTGWRLWPRNTSVTPNWHHWHSKGWLLENRNFQNNICNTMARVLDILLNLWSPMRFRINLLVLLLLLCSELDQPQTTQEVTVWYSHVL